MKLEFESTNCNVCGSSEISPVIEVDKYREGKLRFVRCDECALVYQNPRPTSESLLALFASEEFMSSRESGRPDNEIVGYYDYLADEPFRMRLARYRLRKVERLFPAGKKLSICKIACGSGSFLKVAQDNGHQVLGVDASPTFVQVARERYGVSMILSPAEEADLGDASFDVIMLLGALNNMSSLAKIFQQVRRHLAPGGFFIFNYFDIDNALARFQKENYWLYRPPVLYHFTRPQMKAMMDRFGWRIVKHEQDIQYTNLAKLFGFLGIKPLWAVIDRLKLHHVIIKIPILSCYWCVVQRVDES